MIWRRLGSTGLATLAAIMISAALTAASASAWATFTAEPSFGTSGTGSAGVKGPLGVAVNATSGNVYVADFGNQRVDEFEASGAFSHMFGYEVDATTKGNVCPENPGDTCQAGKKGTHAGQFASPYGVVVDQADGDVYVVDSENHRVQKFTAEGKFALMFGGGVNKKGGNVCTAAEEVECEAGKIGTGPGEFKAWPLGSFAGVGPGAKVYVGDENRVQEFNENGVYQGEIALAGIGKVNALAVDAIGNVYLKGAGKPGLREFTPNGAEVAPPFDESSGKISAVALDNEGRIFLMDEEGGAHILYDSLSRTPFAAPFGSGLIGASVGEAWGAKADELYVSDYKNNHILPFKRYVLNAVTGTASGISQSGAMLEGSLEPEGTSTTYFFEYGTTATYGSSSASTTTAGTGSVPVSVPVAGLEDGTLYHYRIVAENTHVRAIGTDATFITSPGQAIVKAQSAAGVTAFSATLDGAVKPADVPTTYFFEYGSGTAYGHTTPTSMTGGASEVQIDPQTIEGLAPGTTYHYRLVAENEFGRVEGADQTFTTLVAAAPVVITGPAGSVSSTGATLTGAVVSGGLPVSYWFEIGTAGDYYGSALYGGLVSQQGALANVALALTALQPGVTYHYRLAAVNQAGGPVYGADQSFATAGLAQPFSVPMAPALISAPASLVVTLTANSKPKPSCRTKAMQIKNAKKRKQALRRCAKATHKKTSPSRNKR